MAAYVRDFWHSDLKRHFKEEETIVFPLIPADDVMVQQALSEHRSLSGIVGQLTEKPGEADALLTAFAVLLRAHIRFEERDLFPHIEQLATDDDLLCAGKKLQGSTSASQRSCKPPGM
jgi:iron-sulfur cluster repair protein YtfE (RIC family)